MKVGLVLEQFDPRRGGLEQWTARFVEHLAARGHEVHVVAGRFGVPARCLPIVPHRLDRICSRVAFAEAAEARLRQIPLDVIHDMGSGWYCDVFHPHGGSWAGVTEQKLLMSPFWLRPIKRRVDQWLPRQREFRALLARQYADQRQLMVALSRRVADDFQQLHNVDPRRIRTVYNGVDTDHFTPANRDCFRASIRRQLRVDHDTTLALIVAHNFRLKGVPNLLRAMVRLAVEKAPIHLAVVGGKRLEGWRRTARRWGIGDRVSFVGPVDDAAGYYAAADLYVHPTFYDTCSLVVLEAAASGLPLITTRVNGAAELLTDGVDSHILPDPADVDRLCEALRRLLDPAERRRLGDAARQTALQHPFSRNVDQLLAIYGEVAQSRRQAA